jgi:hypothetical protein
MVNTGDYEIVQANKNALSIAFKTLGGTAENVPASDPVLLQKEAYAIYRGIARYHGLQEALQEALQISITDRRTGRPLKGATATLDGVISLTSDGQGQITFHGLRFRQYRMRVTARGYQPVEMPVKAGQPTDQPAGQREIVILEMQPES